eukprot:8406876-Alexandrium_andersonii.AAC.1
MRLLRSADSDPHGFPSLHIPDFIDMYRPPVPRIHEETPSLLSRVPPLRSAHPRRSRQRPAAHDPPGRFKRSLRMMKLVLVQMEFLNQDNIDT